MLRVYLFCIENLETGGIELLHQLCNSINKKPGCEALLYFWMPGSSATDPVPDIYKHYGCPYVVNAFLDTDDVDNAMVVVPEIRTYLFDEGRIFADCRHKCIFWESVDNYFLTTPALSMMSFTRDKGILHLVQSEYARQFLIDEGISEDMILSVSDYLSREYLESELTEGKESERQDIVLYNPKKGLRYTQKVLDELREIESVPIIKMTPAQVRELMHKAKIYIDFGDHPGKDRIPREAAISGLIVITGRDGSAANDIDVPIPEECKLERNDENISAIADKIRDCLAGYDDYVKLYEGYREVIRKEPELFEEQVRYAVEVMQRLVLRPVSIYVAGHKDFVCPDSEEYIPVYIGEASKGKSNNDTVADIGSYAMAKKSGLYHELTALYSIWKKSAGGNGSDIYGLNQYKRFLCTPVGDSLINGYVCDMILKAYDMVLPQLTKINASREVLYCAYYGKKEDLERIRDILRERSPKSVVHYDQTLKASEGHYYNLFVTTGKMLSEYCEWLFDILFEFEKRTNAVELSEGVMSHISELLIDVFIADRDIRVMEVPLCNSEWR